MYKKLKIYFEQNSRANLRKIWIKSWVRLCTP